MSPKAHWVMASREARGNLVVNDKHLVLMVDDHQDAPSELKGVLELSGYNVIGTDNGQDAASWARQTEPDLLLVDLDVPLLYGLVAARQILKHSQLEMMPVVIVSHEEVLDPAPILIVEDHDDSRQMLRVLLEMKGCHVFEACNGLEAVEIEQPELILMDGSLPLLDGLEATRRIRANVQLDDVMILALNGWGTESFHAAALIAGRNDCIAKPIDFDQLESYIAPLFTPAALAA